jgi:hypothetical protein
MPEWLPIETAPQDETVFIATIAGDNWVCLCAWWPLKNPKLAGWVRCEGCGDGKPHVMYVGSEPGSDAWWIEPTHWMPFPDPIKLR